MHKKLLIFICLLSSSFQLLIGQEDVKVFVNSLKGFPSIDASIIMRNPAGVDSGQVIIIEDNKVKNLIAFNEVENDSVISGKSVLILFENHYNRPDQTNFFQSLLSSTMSEVIDDGDEFYFASFDWNRDELGNNTLDFGSELATENSNDIVEWADNVFPKSHKYTKEKGTLIHRAISEAIDFMEDLTTENSKVVVILSSGFSSIYDQEVDATSVIAKSLKNNIPVYSIEYDLKLNDKYTLEEISNETFGLCESFSKNDLSSAKIKFISFLGDVVERSKGKKYQIKYSSDLPKDGDLKSVEVEIKGRKHLLSFITPKPTFGDWLKANAILATIIGLMLLIIIVLVIVILVKRKKKNIQSELERSKRMSSMEEANRSAQDKIKKQEDTLKHNSERDRIQAEKELLDKQNLARKEREAELIVIMKQNGIPRFTGSFEGQYGELMIDKPTVSIGRKDSNYYILNHPTVSGEHAEIVFKDGEYWVNDLNSSNGTKINGRNIKSQKLNHSDILQVGEIELTFLK